MIGAIFLILMGMGLLCGVYINYTKKRYNDITFPLLTGLFLIWFGTFYSPIDTKYMTPNNIKIIELDNKIIVEADEITQNFISIEDYIKLTKKRDNYEIKIYNKINMLGNVFDQYIAIIDK